MLRNQDHDSPSLSLSLIQVSEYLFSLSPVTDTSEFADIHKTASISFHSMIICIASLSQLYLSSH